MSYASVHREPAGLRLSVVLANGDAYDQVVEDVEGQSPRVAASSLAALLDSIAGGEVAPSRTDVEIPPPEAEVEPGKEPAAEDPEPTPQPAGPPVVTPGPRPSPARFELGPVVAPQLVIGVAPSTDASVLAAAGASLGIDARHQRGGLLTFDVRVAGRSGGDLSVARLRVAAGGGWAWRRGALEVPLAGAVTVEPWWVRRDGARADLERDPADGVRARPALGALLRVAPGFFVDRPRPRVPAIRIGARAEVAGSFVPDGGARTVELGIDEAGVRDATLRLGGLELTLGLDVALWFGLGGR